MGETKNEKMLNISIELIAKTGPSPGSVWRHKKGGVYRVVCCAIEEDGLFPVVVYQTEYPQGDVFKDKEVVTWTRPLLEFTDGRFTIVKGT